MAASADDPVELTELDVITRYSLAVRHASAPRDELIATLRSDLTWLEGGRQRAASSRSTAKKAAPTRTTPSKATPRRTSR